MSHSRQMQALVPHRFGLEHIYRSPVALTRLAGAYSCSIQQALPNVGRLLGWSENLVRNCNIPMLWKDMLTYQLDFLFPDHPVDLGGPLTSIKVTQGRRHGLCQ